MPATNNISSDLTLNSEAYRLGDHMFKSFLLAGERYVNSGMQRPNTDEERFKVFYNALPGETQEPVKSYFKRQSTLDLSQRAQILGTLTNIKIEDQLTINKTAPDVVISPTFRSIISQIVANRANATPPAPPAPSAPAPSVDFNTLRLYLNKLVVEEAQDDWYINYIFGKKYFNQTDEVRLGIISTDETGEVKHDSHVIGSIDEGKQKSYSGDGLQLSGFDLREGSTFPKFYSVMVVAIEADNGTYNNIIAEGAKYIKEKVTKELLAKGIIATGAYYGVTIPPVVANYIANIAKSFFDSLINWLKGLFSNDDDVLGTASATATINGLVGSWHSNGTLKDNPFDWVFSGQDGRWRTTMHWQLVKK